MNINQCILGVKSLKSLKFCLNLSIIKYTFFKSECKIIIYTL